MRSHSQIIEAAGGVAGLARAIGAPYNRVRQWPGSDSIPAPYWSAVVAAGFSTLDELAAAAERKRPEIANDTHPQSEAA